MASRAGKGSPVDCMEKKAAEEKWPEAVEETQCLKETEADPENMRLVTPEERPCLSREPRDPWRKKAMGSFGRQAIQKQR